MLRYLFGIRGPSGFSSSSTASQVADRYADRCAGRTFIVTGANSGIGKESARVLALRGAHVIMACRSADRMAAAAREIEAEVGAAPAPAGGTKRRVTQEQLDLASLASVRAFAARVAAGVAVSSLICNAGVMMCPATATADGYEMQFGSNVLGHWLLVELLRPALLAASKPGDPARVVVVASEAHRVVKGLGDVETVARQHAGKSYGALQSYGYSKVSNILHAREFNRREREKGGAPAIVAFALHPGTIKTELGRHRRFLQLAAGPAAPFLKSIPQGAATQLYVALAPEADPVVPYWADCNPCGCTAGAMDDAKARELWEWCAAAAARQAASAK